MKAAGRGWVGVGVDKTGDDRPALQVDLCGQWTGQGADLIVVADSKDPPVCDRDGASPRPEWIDGDDVSPVED